MNTTGNNAIGSTRAVEICGDDATDVRAARDDGQDCETAQPFATPAGECSQILHALANVMTGVLMNAQMLDWKLPPYSRLKRPVREIERAAQRATELATRLRSRLVAGSVEAAEAQNQDQLCRRPLSSLGAMAAVTAQEPGPPQRAGFARSGVEEPGQPGEIAPGAAKLSPLTTTSPAPVFCPPADRELTWQCDPCTSANFPKRDDGDRN